LEVAGIPKKFLESALPMARATTLLCESLAKATHEKRNSALEQSAEFVELSREDAEYFPVRAAQSSATADVAGKCEGILMKRGKTGRL
jgi:hypothetical protein